MDNLAERQNSQPHRDDSARQARASILRAVLAAMAPMDREIALADVSDLLPDGLVERLKGPQRGGEVLNNVYDLFKREPDVARAAPEVKETLAREGKDADVHAIRNALHYLKGRSLLRKIGYGKYQLEDGRIVDGPP